MNKQYEIIYLTKEDPQITNDKTIIGEIENLGGKITNTNSLGEKTLVYPIKKEKSAFYTSTVFELESEKLQDLNRKLILKEEILRYLIVVAKLTTEVKTEKKPSAKMEIKPKEIIKEKIEVKEDTKEAEVTKEEKIIKKPETKEIKQPKVEKPVAKKKKVEETSEEDRLKALDEKLNELLKE